MTSDQTHRGTYAHIDLAALKHNFQCLREMLPKGAFFCPMVKANAYGHGDAQVCQALQKVGAQNVGVVSLKEALRLREKGVDGLEILIFGHVDAGFADDVVAQKMTLVLSYWQELEALAAALASKNKIVPIHIKFNTGMNRLGFSPEERPKIEAFLKSHPKLKLQGVLTHFLNGEDGLLDSGRTQEQIQKFNSLSEGWGRDVKIHAFNSASLISQYVKGEKAHWGARPGIALYGVKPHLLSPSSAQAKLWEALDLRPVMSLRSRVVALQEVQAGETVSYGGTYRADSQRLIGVLPIGYADGFSRRLSNRVNLLLGGQRVPQVGTVCMDYTMVDLTEVARISKVSIGDEAVIWGRQGDESIDVDYYAGKCDTIAYEILLGIGPRVPRVYQG